ncbi:hypothetical protein JCM19236_1537 [Vibrio sp. JCM 19236]|nr:hypothetical protein JCM19236_1537 [Vibrio sp. JCM 19236]
MFGVFCLRGSLLLIVGQGYVFLFIAVVPIWNTMGATKN